MCVCVHGTVSEMILSFDNYRQYIIRNIGTTPEPCLIILCNECNANE